MSKNLRSYINDFINLQMTYERDGAKDCDAPKHGKVDPTGNPHVGGNTWAGGTGKYITLHNSTLHYITAH